MNSTVYFIGSPKLNYIHISNFHLLKINIFLHFNKNVICQEKRIKANNRINLEI